MREKENRISVQNDIDKEYQKELQSELAHANVE